MTETVTTTSSSESATVPDLVAAQDAPKPQADWTIMIYMSGDNELANDCIRSLTEIKGTLLADPDRVRVIAQIDPEDPRMETRRLVLNKNKGKSKSKDMTSAGKPDENVPPAAPQPESPTDLNGGRGPGRLDDDKIDLEPGKVRFHRRRMQAYPPPPSTSRGDTNMADPETLFDFISRSKDECPAAHYMLVLDGHSAGVEEGFLLKDKNPPGSMSLSDLKDVLEAVRHDLDIKLDVLGMDSCLMNMLEICYEFKDVAKILVGSQGLVPGHGWPFANIAESLARSAVLGEVTAEELGKTIVKSFINSYLENSIVGGLSVDAAALRMAKSPDVANAVHQLATLLADSLLTAEDRAKLVKGALPDSDNDIVDSKVMDQIILSHWRAQSFNGELYVDLWDFCELLKRYFDDKEAAIPKQCQEVQDTVEAMRVMSCFSGIEYQHAHGLSIYFPWAEMMAGYKDLDFAKQFSAGDNGRIAGWCEFLIAYLHATRRETQGGGGVAMRLDFRHDPPWKKDPPYQGPDETAHSMRNPPREYPRISNCLLPGNENKFNDFLTAFGSR